MIKNIVFDMGRVLLDYDADLVCQHFVQDEVERKAVQSTVFESKEWILLDMGVISEEDALKKMQARLETAHAKEMASLCLKHWHEYNLFPIEEMGKLVSRLKADGYGIYLCSNASIRLLECYDRIPGSELFDGMLFSAEVKCIKPQKEIYGHLFERFQLKPEECFFIDDLPMNIEGAKTCGMAGHCFADGDVDHLKKALTGIGWNGE